MRVPFVCTAILLTGLAWHQGAVAQLNEKFSDLTGEIEMLRSMAQVERQAIVADAMLLTGEEAAAFWPVYREYREAVARINDRLLKVVSDYGAQREALTDAQAKELLADYFDYEQDMLKTRKQYVARFGKALPMTKVTRFYQIDNKLDVILRLALAVHVPLAKQ